MPPNRILSISIEVAEDVVWLFVFSTSIISNQIILHFEREIYTGGDVNENLLAYLEWKGTGGTKIVLGTSHKTLEGLTKEEDAFPVVDGGETTQVPSGSLTLVAFGPCEKGDSRFRDFILL